MENHRHIEEPPFPFIELPTQRTYDKPRQKGVTMVIDPGHPNTVLQNYLEISAPFMDYGKIETATARIYSPGVLKEKVALYKSFGVKPFIGGVCLERTLKQRGLSSLDIYLEEMDRFNLTTIEVSDNYDLLTPDERRSIIETCVARGFEVLAEVGFKDTHVDSKKLVALIHQDIEAGAEFVIIEGAELYENGRPNQAVIETIGRHFGSADQLMFELSGPWLPDIRHCDVYKLLVFLIETFGPDVSIGNISLENVFETESDRLGLHTL